MISVLVPYRPDGGHRDRAWAWLSQRWAAAFPYAGWEVITDPGEDGEHPGEFNHPLAINRCAACAKGEVFVIADADTAFDPHFIQLAADTVQAGVAPWVLPRYYDKVDETSTEMILAGPVDGPIEDYAVEWRGDSVSWSGLVVVPRDGFLAAGGYDERIAWWGADDVAFATTMNALWGRAYRLDGAAIHLWHPQPLEHTYGHEKHREQQALVDRYIATAGDADAVREVRFG